MSLLSRRSKSTNKAARRRRPLSRPDFELLEDRRLLAPLFLVTNTNDSGPDSLRQAILNANANPGLDTIDFAISGPAPYIITLASALPAITDPIVLDGSSQTGFVGTPLIQINGVGLSGDGLILGAGSTGSTVKDLDIYHFSGAAIHLLSNKNVVQGNYLGTDVTGTAAGPGNSQGVLIDDGASDNTIGGTGAGAGNVISGNSGDGIDILSDGNFVLGNKIGTNAAGTAALGNGTPGVGSGGAGVRFFGGAFNTVANNVISGNVNEGIFFHGDLGASHEMVLGNLVGTNFAGTAAIPNGLDGISLYQSAGNTIQGNIISGNGDPFRTAATSRNGIKLFGSDGNLIQANLIGTDATGERAVPNSADGILIDGSSDNTIGGTTPQAQNIISGNSGDGINISTGSTGNLIEGNSVGTNAAGEGAVDNGGNGVSINDVSGNTIGGTVSGAGNVISGNGLNGLLISAGTGKTQTSTGSMVQGNTVQGNRIGTDVNGATAIGNGQNGVFLNGSPVNTIGGTTPGAGNVISGNLLSGVSFFGLATTGNLLLGNRIGTDAGGTLPVGNMQDGVLLTDAPGNFLGGTEPGSRNLISGNVGNGIEINGAGSKGNAVQGDFIGLDINGTYALPNADDGVVIVAGASSNLIGGTSAAARNVVSGNGGNGVTVSNATGVAILGNFIGTDATGTQPVPNAADGILLDSSSSNVVGAPAVGAGNVISGNSRAGVQIDPGATKNLVQGNFIGTDATGKRVVPNVADGVLIGESFNNTIGGTAVGAGNVISYNGGNGVSFSSGARSNVVQGNNISVNSGAGVSFGLGTTNNMVQGNLISGNIGGAVSGPGVANNLVQGNLIPGNGEPSLPPPNNTQPAIQLVPAQSSSLALIATLVVTSLTGGESQGMSTASVAPNQAITPSGKGGEGAHAADESENPQGGLSLLIPPALRPWVLVLLGTNEALARIRGIIPDLFTSGDGQQGPVELLSRAYQAVVRTIDEAIHGMVQKGHIPSLPARVKGWDIDELAASLAEEGPAQPERARSAVPLAAGPATDPAEVLPDTSKSTRFRLVNLLAVSVASIGALDFRARIPEIPATTSSSGCPDNPGSEASVMCLT